MKCAESDGQFHTLTRRKLKVYGGIPVLYDGMVCCQFTGTHLQILEPMPKWVQSVINQLNKLRPANLPGNHVLFNQYEEGQGIGGM